MRAVVTLIVVALALLTTVGSAEATEYTYKDGFYWNGGNAYVRELVYSAPTYSYNYGYYYQQPRTAYYRYYAVPVATRYINRKVIGTKSWRDSLLAVVKQRDAIEGKIRSSIIERDEYLEALGKLGMTQPQYAPGYGYGALATSKYSRSYVAQGATEYGYDRKTYSVNQVTDYYGQTDMGALYLQASQLVKGAQSLAGDAGKDFMGIVAGAGDNAGRVAEALARGRAAELALKAAAGPPSSRTTTTITGTEIAPKVMERASETEEEEAPAPIRKGANGDAFFQTHAGTCVDCHVGAKAKGGFDIRTFTANAPFAVKRRVWARITSTDPKLVMPPPDSGTLPEVSFKAFLRR